MTNWKGKLDSKSLTLIRRAARSQVELGMDEIVFNRNNVADNRQHLIDNGLIGIRKNTSLGILDKHKADLAAYRAQ